MQIYTNRYTYTPLLNKFCKIRRRNAAIKRQNTEKLLNIQQFSITQYMVNILY